MSVLVNSSKIVLLLLGGAGFYATWWLLMGNGSVDQMSQIRDSGPRLLPGTKEPIKTKYTGIAFVDYQLTVLDLFFWEQLDGSRPEASLFCYHFAGQVFSGWTLLMVESMRNANSWRIISFIAIWGIGVQTLAYAVIIPIFLILHLSTSPTVFSTVAADYAINIPDIRSVPISVFFGYAIPTVLMSLPAPSILDFSIKQNLMAFWQFFPLWCSMLQPVTAYLMSLISHGNNKAKGPKPASRTTIKALRCLYAILIIVAGASQISVLSIAAISEFFPSMFASEYAGVMRLSQVFVPQAITTSTKMPSIGDGAFMLLQYDHSIGSFSMALWATVLLVQGYHNHNRSPDYASLVFYGLIALAFTGPLGYAVACIWARDEIVHGLAVDREKKAQ